MSVRAWFRRPAVAVLVLVLGPAAHAAVPQLPDVNLRSLFYDFTSMAQTSVGGFQGLGDAPSINRSGIVVFQATNASGQGVYASDGISITDLTPGFDGASRAFGRAVMVSDTGWVIESDRVSGAPPATFIRAWPGNGSGGFTTLGRGGTAQPFDAVLSHPALSANNTAWAFTALAPGSTVMRLVTPLGMTDLLGNGGTGYRPMVADDGTVVLRDSNAALLQIQLRRGGNPAALQVVAGTSGGFSQLGNQPGISDTGKIVAFSGNRGNGQGVFFAYESTPGTWVVVRGAGEGLAAQGAQPDLGFDIAEQPLYFSAVNVDTRVAVMHQERGVAGLEGDTIVLAFAATPNGASIYPRFGNYPGLFFRAAAGLWTLRMDFYRDSAGVLQVRRRYALPVVQIGDTISGAGVNNFVVANFAVHDPIAEATADDLGRALQRPAGSHRVAVWASDAAGQQVILRATQVNSCLVAVRQFSQCDARWANQPYVATGDNFCAKACALTAQTMAANTGGAFYDIDPPANPLDVHNFIRPRGGFSGAGVNWQRSIQALRQPGGPLTARPNTLRFEMTWHSVRPTSSQARVDAAMGYIDDQLCDDTEPRAVVVAADREPGAGTTLVPGHFIVVAGRSNDRRFIADPGYANGIVFSQGPNHNPVSHQYQNNFETRGVVRDPPNLGGMTIAASGAARLLVTGANGQRSGMLPAAEEPLQEISGATFFVDGLRNIATLGAIGDVVWSFQTPQPGILPYVIQLVGGGGAYTLSTDIVLPDGTLTQPVTVSGTAAAGEVVAYTIIPLAGGLTVQRGSTLAGDLDGDLDVDSDDVNYLLFDRNKPVTASRCGARCDLNGDGRIDTLDARKLSLMCTRAGCARK